MNAQRNRGMYLRFGERLAEIRKSRKISQAKLAKLLGAVEGTIQNYEHGRLADIRSTLRLHTWILSVNTAGILAIVGQTIVGPSMTDIDLNFLARQNERVLPSFAACATICAC
jgi:transcriptional regulator with XRE-family HTH domain